MALETRTVLSQDLQPGDRLLSAALGGTWGVRVTSVRVYPDGVAVLLGTDCVRLEWNEVCAVERHALGTVAQLRAQVGG